MRLHAHEVPRHHFEHAKRFTLSTIKEWDNHAIDYCNSQQRLVRTDYYRTARIMADNVEIGRVKSGETVDVQVPDHSTNLYAKMDWGRSNPYPVSNVKDGQTIYMNIILSFI